MGIFRCGTLLFLPWDDYSAVDHEAAQTVNDDPPEQPLDHNVKRTPAGGGTPTAANRRAEAQQQRLLPRPRWAPIRGAPLAFDTTAELEVFLAQLEQLLGEELRARRYNTLGNLLRFYGDYKRRGSSGSLASFLRDYPAMVVEEGLSCVGLSLHLCSAMKRRFPRARPFLVSCEEWIPDVASYCSHDPPDASSVKEHVLVALRVQVPCEGRRGLVLLDPGYHVGFPVVVMDDGRAPHSGHFVQSHTSKSTKEYCYEAVCEGYVLWRVTETRMGRSKTWDNVLYVGGAFQSALAYSEKRNLLYDFRTLVARRDGRGPTAGVYCKLDEMNRNPVFTLFYTKDGQRTEAKLPFALFGRNAADVVSPTEVAECAEEVGMAPGELLQLLIGIADVYEDVDFINQLLDLNRKVDPFEG